MSSGPNALITSSKAAASILNSLPVPFNDLVNLLANHLLVTTPIWNFNSGLFFTTSIKFSTSKIICPDSFLV